MMRANSILKRLTLYNLALMSVLFAVLVAAQYFLLRAYLNNQTDSYLRGIARAAIQRYETESRGTSFESRVARIAYDLNLRDSIAAGLRVDGQLILPSREGKVTLAPAIRATQQTTGNVLPPQRPPNEFPSDQSLEARAQILRMPPPPVLSEAWSGNLNAQFAVDLAPEGPAHVVLLPLYAQPPVSASRAPDALLMVAGLSAPTDRALSGLLLINAIAFVVGLIGVAALAALAARRALAPLEAMVPITQRFAAGDFGVRAPTDSQTPAEVAQLGRAFNTMVVQIDELISQQRQFVADASHELRTPLTAIHGSLDVLMLHSDQLDESARQQLLGNASNEVARLSRLVNDLLTLSKTERGDATPLQNIALAPLMSELTLTAQTLIELSGKDIALTVTDTDARVLARADALRQVLLNLLDNAIKFSPQQSQIEIAARVDTSRDIVEISVRDHGDGIAPEHVAHVFDRFYRGDAARARERDRSGSGLGLAIARALVQSMGGEISCSSEIGRGTTFVVRLKSV